MGKGELCPECKGKGIWERDGGLVYGTCETCQGEKTIEAPMDLPVNDESGEKPRSHKKKGKA